jgi:tRNA-splicing ligase RtcB
MAHEVREAVRRLLGDAAAEGTRPVYDLAHNVAKLERHVVDGREREVCVHRKGATRSFGPGHPELPSRYRDVGQPVLIPGSMGGSSFVLVGTNESAELAFSSTCHGAGRMMSRKQAAQRMSGHQLRQELEKQGILVRASQPKLLAEEAPYAYKEASEVVRVCDKVGLSKIVARLRPVGVVKG